MLKFRELLGRTVSRLFLVVWPPLGEQNESDIDISFGIVFSDEPNKLYVISVDKNEIWSPYIFYHSLPKDKYTWKDFYPRIKMWMNSEDDNCIVIEASEYFDVTNCELFQKIVDSKIIDIVLIGIEGIPEPFGIKILFSSHDYIISTPISDGNTVETTQFNRNNNIDVFKKSGKIEYRTII
jgi:hypothetical protein